MKSRFAFIFLFILGSHALSAQQLSENKYRIFSVKLNKEVPLSEIIQEMKHYDVLFFGEEHNDSVTHDLERTTLELLFNQFGTQVTLSMEMFDRDVQSVMNEYLGGFIREKNFKKDARVWSNYSNYRPMVEFVKDKKLDLICANAAGRYSNLAGRKGQTGLMELPKESKKFFAPLPYDTASGKYYEKLVRLTQHDPSKIVDTSQKKMPILNPMGSFNLMMAQSLWDATMAYSISDYLKHHKHQKVMQVNGRFHSDEGFAVVTQLHHYNPKLKTLIVSTCSDDAFPNIDWNKYKTEGDFIIITDPKVPKTYEE